MRKIGDKGEDAAARFLKRCGYKILERNYYSRFGEIDIIAQKDEYLVFVEVKLRRSDDYGGGQAAVTPQKQQRIRLTAQCYLQKHDIEPAVRFDVVLIHSDGEKIKTNEIEVLENAFGI